MSSHIDVMTALHRTFTGLFAIAALGGGMYMAINQIPTPEWLILLLGAAGGWFFGSETQAQAQAQKTNGYKPPDIHITDR